MKYLRGGALGLIIGYVLIAAPVITATAQPQQCATPHPGSPLTIDIPLPHDLTTGVGVGIALVDTGASTPGVMPGRAEGSLDLDHCILHGTAVAGVLHTIAPDAMVVSHQQTTENGTGTVEGLVDAIERATDHARRSRGLPSSAANVRILNISLVACQDTSELRRAIGTAQDAGLLIVAAAGNTGQCPEGAPPYPAALPGVLTVGGVDIRALEATTLPELGLGRQSADYSIPGSWVDLFAPGGPVSTVLKTGSTETTIVGDPDPFLGTSFAAPVVSASAALLWQLRPELSAAQVRELLIATVQPGVAPVVDPVAAVTALLDNPKTLAEPAMRESPWPVEVGSPTGQKQSADLRVPAAVAATIFISVIGSIVIRGQSTSTVRRARAAESSPPSGSPSITRHDTATGSSPSFSTPNAVMSAEDATV